MRQIDANTLKSDFDSSLDYDYEGIMYIINAQPTISPRRGEWREAYEFDIEVGKELMCGFECSVCYSGCSMKTNYCPSCGAAMSGADVGREGNNG